MRENVQIVHLRRVYKIKEHRKQVKYCMFRGTCYGKPYSWEDIPIKAKQFDSFMQITRQFLRRAAEIEESERKRENV